MQFVYIKIKSSAALVQKSIKPSNKLAHVQCFCRYEWYQLYEVLSNFCRIISLQLSALEIATCYERAI